MMKKGFMGLVPDWPLDEDSGKTAEAELVSMLQYFYSFVPDIFDK